MCPELSLGEQEPSFRNKVRDALVHAAPEFSDLIMGRDTVVNVYC